MSKQCRLCAQFAESTIDLFLPHETSLLTKINSFLPIAIKKDSKLPSKICCKCVDRSIESHSFIQKILLAQQSFGIRTETDSFEPTNSVSYGGITISSSNNAAINVPLKSRKKATKSANISDTLIKLKNMQTGNLIISKTVVPGAKFQRKCRTIAHAYKEENEDSDDDDNYEPQDGGSASGGIDNDMDDDFDADNYVPPKRGRGRPPKKVPSNSHASGGSDNNTENDYDPEDQVPLKKGRGRPPKKISSNPNASVGSENDTDNDYDPDDNVPLKRVRGRPPKKNPSNPSASDYSDNDTDDDYNPDDYEKPKRNRARPAKKVQPNPSKSKEEPKYTPISVTSAAAFLCMKCRNRFASLEELKQHIFQSNECKISDTTCKICKTRFATKKSLVKHMKIHGEREKIVCDKCGRMYTNQLSLENHKASEHGEYVDGHANVFKCRECQEKFTNRTDLYNHVRSCQPKEEAVLCDTCGKCFGNKNKLKLHQKSHLDIRPFACMICPKTFNTRLVLKQHMHVHTGIKEFHCSQCPQSFAKADSLRHHRRKQHPLLNAPSNEIPLSLFRDIVTTNNANAMQANIESANVTPQQESMG